MPHLNIEFKARCVEPDKIRSILKAHKAEFKGEDHQIDTYFHVKNGRLKLREGNIENHLIHYIRGNESGPKQSHVSLFKTEPNSPLKDILVKSSGVLAIVDKKREIYFIDNVKFHIDTVEGLGSFIEVEAIDHDGSIGKDTLQKQCTEYQSLLGVQEKDLVSVSYSDLILQP